MILYQLAKWMEERKRLKQVIAETQGVNPLLMERKQQVEQIMLLSASKWLEPEQEPSVPLLDPFLAESFSAPDDYAAAPV